MTATATRLSFATRLTLTLAALLLGYAALVEIGRASCRERVCLAV